MAAVRISGTLAAAVTPLRDGGTQVDEDAFAPLLGFYGATGLDGLLVLGTTGRGFCSTPRSGAALRSWRSTLPASCG